MTDTNQEKAPDDGGLTSAELDYLKSGGTKTDGLVPPDEPAPPPEEPASPPPAAEAEPEAPDDDDEPVAEPAAADKAPAKPQTVNFYKYEREREARKKLEADIATLREQQAGERARLQERLDLINHAIAQPKDEAEEDKEPDPDVDIFSHNKWLARQHAKARKEIEELRSARVEQDQTQNMLAKYRSDAENFAKENQDFQSAYQHLIRNRLAELEIWGMADPAERDRIVLDEERNLVARNLELGRSPAQAIYALAKARGYVTPADASKAGKALSQVAQVKKAQAAAQSLSQGGGAAVDQLTPEVLANMRQDEFDELMRKLPKHRVRQLLGS